MGPPLLGPLTQVGEQVTREVASNANSLSNTLGSGWGGGLGLLMLLPFIGIFLRPILRISGTLTHSIAAVTNALIVCVSSWLVLAMQHITALTHALRPTPQMLPVMRIGALCGVLCLMVHCFSIPLYYVAAAGSLALAGWILHSSKILPRLRSYSRGRNRKALILLASGSVIIIVASLAANALWSSHTSLSTCLVNGAINQGCVKALHGQRF